MFDLNNNLSTGASFLALAKSIYIIYVYYQVKHRLQVLTLVKRFDITHWFSCGADSCGADGLMAYRHVITKISGVDRLPNFLRYVASLARGAPLITRVRRHTSSL